MKKIAIFSVLGILFGASVATGALKVQEIKHWDYIAQVQTLNKGNVMIYKVVDGDNTCYVGAPDEQKWGSSPSISCVNAPVVPVVKK